MSVSVTLVQILNFLLLLFIHSSTSFAILLQPENNQTRWSEEDERDLVLD
jgi:hypothetical protein